MIDSRSTLPALALASSLLSASAVQAAVYAPAAAPGVAPVESAAAPLLKDVQYRFGGPRFYGGPRYYRGGPVVVWGYRPWYRRPYYGRVIAGVAIGTIVVVTAYGIAPPRPRPDLCWYWADRDRSRGYWDYC